MDVKPKKQPTYIIAKNATKYAWSEHYAKDPQLGLHPSFSAHNTPTGVYVEMLPIYDNYKRAELDCKLALEFNPLGKYAVCLVKTRSKKKTVEND